MLIVWWTLWLYPVMAMAPDLDTCSRKWVRMTDQNYQRAIKHYADCVLLGQALDPPAREVYQSNIVINLQKTCDYFFQRTSLSTSGLIGVVREVAKILEGFEQETITKRIVNNDLSWSTIKAQCISMSSPENDNCLTPTQSPPTSDGNSETTTSQYCCSQSGLYFMLLVFLLLLIFQILFLCWFCCCNNCILLEMCKSGGACCLCDNEDSCAGDTPATEVYHMTEIQHDLASLSSENIGSDSEFEALLKMTKLPKTNRQWHSKEAD